MRLGTTSRFHHKSLKHQNEVGTKATRSCVREARTSSALPNKELAHHLGRGFSGNRDSPELPEPLRLREKKLRQYRSQPCGRQRGHQHGSGKVLVLQQFLHDHAAHRMTNQNWGRTQPANRYGDILQALRKPGSLPITFTSLPPCPRRLTAWASTPNGGTPPSNTRKKNGRATTGTESGKSTPTLSKEHGQD